MSNLRPEPSASSASESGATPRHDDAEQHASDGGIIRRSMHAMSELLNPFSATALSKLPDTSQRHRGRERRADRIPDPLDPAGRERDTVVVVPRDCGATIDHPVPVRVPKKIATPIKVEGKVWFANERTWIAYLNMGVLLGTLALALLNASEDPVARHFAYLYALISAGVIVYGWVIYQKRITKIRRRDPGHFDQVLGPVVISTLLFFAVLANFLIRVKELRRKGIPTPQD